RGRRCRWTFRSCCAPISVEKAKKLPWPKVEFGGTRVKLRRSKFDETRSGPECAAQDLRRCHYGRLRQNSGCAKNGGPPARNRPWSIEEETWFECFVEWCC